MVCASGLAVALRPSINHSNPQFELERIIPMKFGGWEIDSSVTPVAPSPDLQAALDRAYDQVLSRTYINSRGYRMMLSVAFSSTYSKGTQYHRPEICYPSQGFKVSDETDDELKTPFGVLPEKRLVATAGSRNEPITYWFVVGGEGHRSALGARIAQVKSGMTGRIPDGMLVRVSSIDGNKTEAYQTHDDFILKLLAAMPPESRKLVIGNTGS